MTQSTATCYSVTQAAEVGNSAAFDSAAQRNKVIGRVDSVLTRHTIDGDVHFMLLVLADGQLWRGQWRAAQCEMLPVLGDVLRVEIRTDETQPTQNGNSQILANTKINKPCFQVEHWAIIPQLVSLSGLSQWYQAAHCPATLDRLLALIQRMKIPVLQAWLVWVLRHRNLAQPFFQLPASRQHHHSYPGGLLLHSVECAEWVERIANVSLGSKEAALGNR